MKRYTVKFMDAAGVQREACVNAKSIFRLEWMLTLFGCSSWTIVGNWQNLSWSNAPIFERRLKSDEAKTKNSTSQPKPSRDTLPNMALGLTYSDGKPAEMARGRYQTRNSRVAEITGFHMVDGVTGGTHWTRKQWDGHILDAAAKNVETTSVWDEEGHQVNGGVSSPFDLSIVMSQEFDPPVMVPSGSALPIEIVDVSPALLENQILCAALLEELSTVAEADEKPVETLKRVVSERDQARKQVADLLAAPVV
jgi:hypothetical protein